MKKTVVQIFFFSFYTFLLLTLLQFLPLHLIPGMEVSSSEWVEMEPHHPATHSSSAVHSDMNVWGDRANGIIEHECIFYLHSPGKDQLEKILLDISNPSSPNYGKHLSKEEVDKLTANTEGIAAVTEYLNQVGARITKHTGTSISAMASLSVWEHALHTQFFSVQSQVLNNETIYRAHQYFLPKSIAHYVNFVSNTVQMPVQISRGPIIGKPLHKPRG